MLPSRLACTRPRPKFNKSPLDIMMGVIVFVLFQIGKWFRGNYGNCHPATQNKLFWFYTHQHSGFKCLPLKKSFHSLSSNPYGLWMGQSHHKFSFFAQRQCKVRVRVPKRIIFWKSSKGGWGLIFNPNFLLWIFYL